MTRADLWRNGLMLGVWRDERQAPVVLMILLLLTSHLGFFQFYSYRQE